VHCRVGDVKRRPEAVGDTIPRALTAEPGDAARGRSIVVNAIKEAVRCAMRCPVKRALAQYRAPAAALARASVAQPGFASPTPAA
jgi:hypothetical protein